MPSRNLSATLSNLVSVTGNGNIVFSGSPTIDSPIITTNMGLPTGNTAARPATPTAGNLRFNSDVSSFEGYNGTKWGSIGGGLAPTSIKTSGGYVAIANDLVRCNTAASAFSVSFPATPADGDVIGIVDIANSFNAYNLTLLANTKSIESNSPSYVLDINGAAVSFVYNSSTTNWKLLQVTNSLANSAFSQANTALTTGQSAYTQANTALTTGQSAFSQANTGISVGQGAFGQANSVYNTANTALTTGQSAFGQANSAYTQANTALTTGQSAYTQANTALTTGQSAFSQANAAYNTANTKFSANGGTISGSVTITTDLNVTGNVYLSGNVTTLSSNNLSITDPLIYLAENNPANLQDIGFVGNFTTDRYQHTGLARDATDGVWKLFSNVSSEPTATIDFVTAVYDTIKVGSINTSNAIFSIANGSAPFIVASNTIVSNLNSDLLNGQHGTYYTGLTGVAFGQANSAYTQANSALALANAAFTIANTGGGGGLTPTAIKTAGGYTAVANDLVRCNTAASAFSVSFPATPADGDIIGVIDIAGTFNINNLTLLPNSKTIEGDSTSVILDMNGTYVSFVYSSSTSNWKLLETPLGTGGIVTTQIKTSAYTAAVNDLVRCNTTAAVFNVTLPTSPVDGSIINILDVAGSFYSKNLTVLPGGTNTIESDTSLLLDINGTYASLVYNASGTNWKILQTPYGLLGASLELGTTGANVNVGNTAPPTAGQLLTATSATTATWQTPTALSLAGGTMTGQLVLPGSSSTIGAILTSAAEVTTIAAAAATGTINYDVTTQSVLYYTTSASANWTVNVRASSGTTLDTALATGQSITLAFMVTQGATAFYNTAVTIDGVSVTPKWQGGTAPTAGNAAGIDVYTYTITKTASATYIVLASLTQFK